MANSKSLGKSENQEKSYIQNNSFVTKKLTYYVYHFIMDVTIMFMIRIILIGMF